MSDSRSADEGGGLSLPPSGRHPASDRSVPSTAAFAAARRHAGPCQTHRWTRPSPTMDAHAFVEYIHVAKGGGSRTKPEVRSQKAGSRWTEGSEIGQGEGGDCVPAENRKLSSAPAPPYREKRWTLLI